MTKRHQVVVQWDDGTETTESVRVDHLCDCVTMGLSCECNMRIGKTLFKRIPSGEFREINCQ